MTKVKTTPRGVTVRDKGYKYSEKTVHNRGKATSIRRGLNKAVGSDSVESDERPVKRVSNSEAVPSVAKEKVRQTKNGYSSKKVAYDAENGVRLTSKTKSNKSRYKKVLKAEQPVGKTGNVDIYKEKKRISQKNVKG